MEAESGISDSISFAEANTEKSLGRKCEEWDYLVSIASKNSEKE